MDHSTAKGSNVHQIKKIFFWHLVPIFGGQLPFATRECGIHNVDSTGF